MKFGRYSCVGKVAFTERRLAEMAASRKRGRRAYKCGFCRKYHVGRDLGIARSTRAEPMPDDTLEEANDHGRLDAPRSISRRHK